MGTEAIIASVLGIAGAAGGFLQGRRSSTSDAMGIAADTVDMLKIQVDTLTEHREEKDTLISNLESRVNVLESLVTQRAEVEVVHEEIKGVRIVVDLIADKVGA